MDRVEIFNIAAEMDDPAERLSYLNKVCGSDPKLRADIESLLQSDHDVGDYFKVPVIDTKITLDDSLLTESPGSIIGRYKLLGKIGEGGMAVVYMADQTEPIRRKVALKIIKLGMDTKSVIARFEAERQTLAMMDHPNIAKVFDAGATETGRPYFVMELVTGVSITEYCDKKNLITKDRLTLFMKVCNAVQHAHQKGIIHRDIKPTNVMVTQHEGKPVPKVIDFGIAKATNQRLTEKTLFTRYAHIIGTPAYMSPEQADLGDMDVDTRSDIYSLGVLLYELLTGTTPFSEKELCEAGYLEIQRVIREQEPPKPSTKLSTLGEILTDIAKYHSSTPDLLTKAIRGDLDWIVMRTLEKARERRYDNVSALVLDVQRHLNDEPILARAPSKIYRIRKFLRRHRIQALAMLMISILSIAIVTILLLLNRSRLQSLQTESNDHERILYQSYMSFAKSDEASAIESLRSILNSRHVGNEAQSLYDKVLTNMRKQITYYSDRIEANPEDAESYLHRAQYYYYLQDKEQLFADMDRYAAILNPLEEISSGNSRFRDLVIGLWGNTPTPLGPMVNSSSCDGGPCISADGLSLYFYDFFEGWGNGTIKMATRETIEDPWGEAVDLQPLLKSSTAPNISADGLSLYIDSDLPGGSGGADICVAARTSVSDPWDSPVSLGPSVNSSAHDMAASISVDGLTLFFQSNRSGGKHDWDLYVTTRASRSDPWGTAINLGPTVNSADFDGHPHILPDGLVLFFTSDRPGGFGDWDIWITIRKTTDDNWSVPMNLGPSINTSAGEGEPCLSTDGRVLYFSDWIAPRPGGIGNIDLWQVSIHPKLESIQQESNTELIPEPVENSDRKEVMQ